MLPLYFWENSFMKEQKTQEMEFALKKIGTIRLNYFDTYI
jgi:hypothetical protein